MADTKISALTAVASSVGANEFAVNEAGASKKASLTQMATFLHTSPALTGTPTAPTATVGTNTTQVATTALVYSGVPLLITGNSGTVHQCLEGRVIRASAVPGVVPHVQKRSSIGENPSVG